ncbi:hypothetical protein FACS1894178_1050 [Bacteroidia bacterium]|nr:hypothetical protein FACS1894178_1050 [Bacteroidia bacterium]
MKNLKLNKLEERNLSEKQMNHIKGGGVGDPCGCGCCYADSGGSSVADNAWSNSQSGLVSGGCKPKVWCTYEYPKEYKENLN